MKKLFIAGAVLASLTASYFYGLFSHRDYLPPYPQLLYIKEHIFPESIGFQDMRSKVPVACAGIRRGRTMVALTFGQSNSGNHGETLHETAGPVFNFFNGKCYRAADPLLGTTGDRGSVWSRLGDRLIAAGLYGSVVFVPIGVGSTTIDQWSPGGYLHSRILNAVKASRAQGLEITHLFWVQGGSEKSTAGDDKNTENYKNHFLSMLRSVRNNGVNAPIYVALATYNGAGVNIDIRKAQMELVDPKNGIFPGADNDVLYQDPANSWERVHLSHRGLELCASAWLAAIRKAEEKKH